MIAKLPANATATDVIDRIADVTTNLIFSVNGSDLTQEEFAAAFDRTFPIALEKFFADLGAKSPELVERIRTQFMAEHEARRAR